MGTKQRVDAKKQTPAQLKKTLDIVFSVYIRLRDNGTCITCGSMKPWKEQQNGHFFSRQYLATRWDEENCNCQCVGCNVFRSGNMAIYAVKITEKYGPKVIQKLDRQRQKITKMTREDYLEMIHKYQKKIDKIRADNEKSPT